MPLESVVLTRALTVSMIVLVATGPASAFHHNDDQDENDQSPWRPGLIAEYRSDERTVTRIDHRLSFLLRPFEAPQYLIPADQWTVEWTGAIDVRVPGRYRFGASVLGRFRLTIQGTPVLNVDSGDSPVPVNRQGDPIDLPFGPARITASFSKGKGRGAALRLHRQLPDGFEESILPTALMHELSEETPALGAWRQIEAGTALIAQKSCLACHVWNAAAAEHAGLMPAWARPFNGMTNRYPREWLMNWIRDPGLIGPHAGMPRLFTGTESDHIDLVAAVEFLSPAKTHTNEDEVQPPVPTTISGRTIFSKSGCIACHALPGETPNDSGGLRPLDQSGRKYSRRQLHDLLISEVNGNGAVSPVGHRPTLNLGELDEPSIDALLSFLLLPSDGPATRFVAEPDTDAPSEFAVKARFRDLVTNLEEQAAFEQHDPALRLKRLGQQVVLRRGCLHCHAPTEGDQPPPVAPTFVDVLRLAGGSTSHQLPDRGCLRAEQKPGVPGYDLTTAERTAIVRVLELLAKAKQPETAPLESLEVRLRESGCTGCHDRNGEPSRFGRRIMEFAPPGRDRSLRDISPPTLDGIGERLQPEWLRAVLLEHRQIRPWLDLRMPHYDRSRVEPLIDLLIRADGLDPAAENGDQSPPADNRSLEGARELVGRTGLNCVGCHDFAEYHATGVRAPDLATITDRLRLPWFRRWLHDPQAIAPGTRMPGMFSAGTSSLPRILGGRETAQVTALWLYLSQRGRQSPLLPAIGANSGRAAIGEPILPVPTSRPLLVRGFMPDHAGLRGIALGYPELIHFAFDSETCQLTRVWCGPFIRHEGWNNDGKGSAAQNGTSILGEIVWREEGGPSVRFIAPDDDRPAAPSSSPAPAPHFDACWVTGTDGGFAWHIETAEKSNVRIEECPEPLPRLGSVAFRRRLNIANVPSGKILELRVFSGLASAPESETPLPSVDEWLRLPQGQFDWFVRRVDPTRQERWVKTAGETAQRKPATQVAQDLWLQLPARQESFSPRIELEYVRLKSGSMPAAGRSDASQQSGK
jgi:cbb3-type cytochrome oxidase cytochrome c subunit